MQEHIAACSAARINLVVGDRIRTAGYSPHAQDGGPYLSESDSPCREILTTPELKHSRVADFADDWPEFAAHLTAGGITSLISAPLTVDDVSVGSLDLYAVGTAAFDVADLAWARAAAGRCADALAAAQEIIGARELAAQLETAMQSRAVIEQAKGILMAVRGVSEDDAFGLIRKTSQDRNIKVRDLAAQIVAGATQISPS